MVRNRMKHNAGSGEGMYEAYCTGRHGEVSAMLRMLPTKEARDPRGGTAVPCLPSLHALGCGGGGVGEVVVGKGVGVG